MRRTLCRFDAACRRGRGRLKNLKMECPGCGRIHTRSTPEPFVCSCKTAVTAGGMRISTAGDTPKGILDLYGGSAVPAAESAVPAVPAAAPAAESPLRFEECDGGARVTGCPEGVSEAVVPAVWNGLNVVEIRARAFRNRKITSVALPETVSRIGKAAFENCHALRRVEGGAAGMHIGESAFGNCVYLKDVRFRGVPEADITAFAGCYQLGVANEKVNYRRGTGR